MKSFYILLLSITIFSCQKEKTPLPIEENSIAISSQLKTDKLQTFEFVLKNDTLISGKEGTDIWIPRDLFENYSNGKIIIINNREETTPLEEVSKDIIAIMNIYVAKVNGMRKYKKPINDVKKCFKENCKKL